MEDAYLHVYIMIHICISIIFRKVLYSERMGSDRNYTIVNFLGVLSSIVLFSDVKH